MAVVINRFNRIINLKIHTLSGVPVIIKCPLRGRKPSIEINGSFTTQSYIPAFNVTIKNLYLDMQGEQYTKLEVEAGYEGNTKVFEGNIISMYQESPGPEGKTVIQCVEGEAKSWLDVTVSLNYEGGTLLTDVLNAIQSKLGITTLRLGKKAGDLQLKEPFMYDGTARGALVKLMKVFEEEKLALGVVENSLRAACLTFGDFIEPKILEYMSAPPQENTGDEAGAYYTTITAPWMPELKIYDKLTIPSRVYIRNFGTVGGEAKTQNIQVTGLQFHFGTTGGTNSMTVQGFLVR